jgi:hypothetical protein
VRGYFDVAAVHMFPGKWRNVAVIIRRFREALDAIRASEVPIFVTEMAWPAAEGRAAVPEWANTSYYRSFITTERGAASRLKAAYTLLGARAFRTQHRLERVHWYTGFSTMSGNYLWDYAGLLKFNGSTISGTPVYQAYKASARRAEGCAKDAAGRCR